ncbi:uncharacterized protein JCM6883_000200 [Sporobolomyces salmoneus]|uniref:uncharacterized protein n=1 Tax=Sporobolomyces salmoneus TaxID=183962 RepID=UPI00317BAF90
MATALLLPLYVTVDTSRSLIVFAVMRSGAVLSPSAITFTAEALKLLVAVGGVLSSSRGSLADRFLLPPPQHDTRRSFFASFKPYLRFAVPALLYGFNNVLFLEALHFTTPALLQVSVLSKLPFTAILHHFVIRHRKSQAMWMSLAVLTGGMVLAGCPEQLWDGEQRANIRVGNLLSGPLIGLTVGAVSACSSVWTELMLKEKVEFWQAQFYLYLWGAVFTGLAAIAANSRVVLDSQSTLASLPAFFLVASVTAATGLVVALILRQRDNLVKLVGASLCITTVFVLQHLLFPLTDGLDFRTTFGIGVLTIATWSYNWYKDNDADPEYRPSSAYVELSTSEDGDTPSSSKTELNSTPLSETQNSPPSPYQPTIPKFAAALGFILLLSSLVSFIPPSERSIKNDVKKFFAPQGIKPAAWDIPVQNLNCVKKFSGGGEVNKNSSFMADLEERIVESGCSVFPVPDAGLITHLFWAGKWRPASHALTIDAWLATQPFKTSSLIWWYEGDGPSPEFAEKYTGSNSPYRNVISFRRWDDSLAEGTCLDGMREWMDADYREELKMPVATRSDLIRLLLLAKFGGIWLDADSIPLRDFTPLVRAGPVAPSYGTTTNNNFLLYGPSWSGVGDRVLSLACQMPYNEVKMKETYPELDMGSHFYWLYNEGVHKLCRTRGCGVGEMALQLIDGMYWSSQSFAPCEETKYPSGSPLPGNVHGPFTWHARMTQHADTDSCYQRESGTLLSAVKARIEGILAHNRLGKGRDLFPGPGYAAR